MDWESIIQESSSRPELATLTTGDDVRVWYKIKEGKKDRLVPFEGIVIRVRGAAGSKTFTVRRLTQGIGVERSFPFNSKAIDRVDVLRHGKTKRSRLYYLRTVVKTTRLATVEKPRVKKESSRSKKSAPASQESSGTESVVIADKKEGALAAVAKPVGSGKQKA